MEESRTWRRLRSEASEDAREHWRRMHLFDQHSWVGSHLDMRPQCASKHLNPSPPASNASIFMLGTLARQFAAVGGFARALFWTRKRG